MAQRHQVRIPVQPRGLLKSTPIPHQIKKSAPPPVVFPATLPVAPAPVVRVANPVSLPSHIYLSGSEHQVPSTNSHIYLRGRSHKISDNISHVVIDGSHGYATNPGEKVFAIPVSRQGITRIGKAQKSTLLLTANVDPNAKHYLVNTVTSTRGVLVNDRISVPHANCVCLVTIRYTALGINIGSSVWETGQVRNTVVIDPSGKSQWHKREFIPVHQEGSHNTNLILRGVDLDASNCFSVEVDNKISHQVQLIADVELLILAYS